MRDRVDAVPAHVLLECYSLLTRLPAPHRLAAPDAASLLAHTGLKPLGLPATSYAALVQRLAPTQVRGGAIQDALVAATARHHGHHLLTRDRRARSTYENTGVDFTLL
ncbi:PIN domain-containing protein [Nocardioides sp. AE5]|uniref:PIN domain-containing protein n=1 Tax=Nocardioides sp. AE5 TaxID=2962573 RepID=UPI0028815A1C|nr:PIN domain-containing protein [Nocardioides sp. AE5]MDT0202964.1 PIN domain-containing protein [Nocardioides sp. AE5]